MIKSILDLMNWYVMRYLRVSGVSDSFATAALADVPPAFSFTLLFSCGRHTHYETACVCVHGCVCVFAYIFGKCLLCLYSLCLKRPKQGHYHTECVLHIGLISSSPHTHTRTHTDTHARASASFSHFLCLPNPEEDNARLLDFQQSSPGARPVIV